MSLEVLLLRRSFALWLHLRISFFALIVISKLFGLFSSGPIKHFLHVSLVITAEIDFIVLFFVSFVVVLLDLFHLEVELSFLQGLFEHGGVIVRHLAVDDENGVAVLSDRVEKDSQIEVRYDLGTVTVHAVQVVPCPMEPSDSDPVVGMIADEGVLLPGITFSNTLKPCPSFLGKGSIPACSLLRVQWLC